MDNTARLKLLQRLEILILTLLLGTIALGTWFNLSEISSRAQKNLVANTERLQKTRNDFRMHMELNALIDNHHQTFDELENEFTKFERDPTNTPENLPKLLALSKALQTQSSHLIKNWFKYKGFALKEEYEEAIGILTSLSDEIKETSPSYLMQLAEDAKDSIQHCSLVMQKMVALDDHVAAIIDTDIAASIQNSASNNVHLKEKLKDVKEQTLLITLIVILLLLISRVYFSRRIADINNESQRSRIIAEEALESKARFLATMSHEIRTPMNGVIGMSHLLMNTPLNKKQTEFVESISLSGDHLLTVINDVLDFSKMEAGGLTLKHEPVEIRSCVESVLSLVSSKALEKNIELTYAVDPLIPLFIESDLVRLRQILTNLIGNAIKFTDEGEVSLRVKQLTQHDSNYTLQFQIQDTGCGIPEHQLGSIFEQFSQADDSLARNHEGTGLGLSISKRLVEIMQGEIWVESTLDKGSCFNFTIKTKKADGKPKPFLQDNVPEIRDNRVLIVSSNRMNGETLMDCCIAWGATADKTHSYHDALNQLNTNKNYDIIVIDGDLSDAKALQLGRDINLQNNPQRPRLILVSSPNSGFKQAVTDNIFDLQMNKPITRSHFFDTLMTVLDKQTVVVSPLDLKSLKLGERLPLRILLAEDNKVNQVVASAILEEMAYKVDIANNGQEALEAAKETSYDVIFMDMQMPVMDGLEATRRIRSDLPQEKQPIIMAMTANAMENDRKRCLEVGMDDYLSKPVLPENITIAIEKHCTNTAKVENT